MKKTLGEVGRKSSLADVDLNKVKPSDRVLSLEEILKDCKRLMTLFFNNEFDEAVEGIQLYQNSSVLHSTALSMLHFLRMMLTMSKNQMDEASQQMGKSLTQIESLRHPRSYKNFLIKPNYNTFSDFECQAEIAYVLTNLIYGCLVALRDQSVLGIVNAGYKVNVAYRTLNECSSIRKTKTNWINEEAKKDFYAVCDLTESAFEIVLSMFPAKLAKLLEYIGFSCNQKHALDLMYQSCKEPDLLTYNIGSFVLTVFNGLIEFVYGIGEKKMDCLNNFSSVWTKRCPNGAFTHLINGITEMNKANFSVAAHCFRRVIDEQDYWPQLHFLSHILLVLCYSVLEDWDKALLSSARLRDKCKWSSSLFYYLHSSNLLVKSLEQTPEERIESRKQIREQLKIVPSLKRKLGGIHVFHEELAITKSKRYLDDLDGLIGAGYELFYFWNLFSFMEDNHQYFEAKLKILQGEIDKLEKDKNDNYKDEEKYYYLNFFKAAMYRHMNKTKEAEQLFRDIIKKEKIIKKDKHIVVHSWYELALIKYDQGELKESKKCLKKVDGFSNYFGEGLTTHRVLIIYDKIKTQTKIQMQN